MNVLKKNNRIVSKTKYQLASPDPGNLTTSIPKRLFFKEKSSMFMSIKKIGEWTKKYGNFLCRKEQSIFTVLFRLGNHS